MSARGGTPSSPVRIVVMGPSGAGKSAVGAALAVALRAAFVDADDLHPAANVDKMSAGIPLTDDDRMPWLDAVGRTLVGAPHLVVACSALTRRYRDRLREWAPDAWFLELQVPRDELDRRLREREHFIPPALLDSQLVALEPLAADEHGTRVHNAGRIAQTVASARAAFEAVR